MLEARGVESEVHEGEGTWALYVSSRLLHRANDEVVRYTAERSVPRAVSRVLEPQPGAVLGACVYVGSF